MDFKIRSYIVNLFNSLFIRNLWIFFLPDDDDDDDLDEFFLE